MNEESENISLLFGLSCKHLIVYEIFDNKNDVSSFIREIEKWYIFCTPLLYHLYD